MELIDLRERMLAEPNGRSIDHVRRVLDELSACKPHNTASPSPPEVKFWGRLVATSLRGDLAAGLSVREIAERHDVSTGVVRGIMHARGWKANRRHVAPLSVSEGASS